ncbi:MAG: hypothetical protein J7647_23685 [Cyanobacteria bacterium SBLK]|nr:hypothetical protein [Cyanobacteria bacterium SBLK]
MNNNPFQTENKQNLHVNAPHLGHISQSGDITGDITQNIYQEKPNFEEINFKDLESQFREKLIISANLIKKVSRERMLILSGDIGSNQQTILLNIAYLLAYKFHQNISVSTKTNITIKQWKNSSTQQVVDLYLELRDTQNPTIFILTEIEPKQINGSSGLEQASNEIKKSGNHYILIGTAYNFVNWHLGEEARKFFPKLKVEEIYDRDRLNHYFIEKLKENNLLEKFEKTRKQEQIIEQLNTPRIIDRFIELFRQGVEINNKSQTESIDIDEILIIVKSDKQFIRKLYYEILNERERLLALGLSFFNDLFEDQLFAALERVVEEVWQKRDPSFQALDYYDLDRLQENYFELTPNNFYEDFSEKFKVVQPEFYKIDLRSIRILSFENRQMLFKIAWESHRRQILTALKVLVSLVKESVQRNRKNFQGEWELYENAMKREKLRNAIAETLSDIGSISSSAISAIQGALFQLATDKNVNVRYVAAQAIARWYDPQNRHEIETLRTLQRFYGRALERDNISQELELEDYIGATVAVTLGEIIFYYYNEEKLDNKFYNWLEELSESEAPYIQWYFGYHTLQDVVPRYLKDRKVQELLKKIAKKDPKLLYPELPYSTNELISLSLAVAYKYSHNRKLVRDILNEWYRGDSSSGLLRAIALTYGFLNYNNQNIITIQDGMLRLEDILLKSKNYPYLFPFWKSEKELVQSSKTSVRSAVISSVNQLILRYFNQVEPQLKNLVKQLTKYERKSLIETLTDVYRNQIEETESTENQINKKSKYLVWKYIERYPLTEVELAMNNWAKYEDNPSAQQISIQALVSFAKVAKSKVQ